MSSFLIEEFKSYKVFMYSGGSHAYNIHLPLPDGKAILHFMSGQLPENSSSTSGSHTNFDCYLHASAFADYIDILRNEKPLFFYYNFDTKVAYITSSDEPVGENE